MKTYKEIQQELEKLIQEPLPIAVEQNLVTMREALVRTASAVPRLTIPVGSWAKFTAALGGGLRVNEFSIMCGPTGSGKTTLSANIAAELIANFVPVFVASVEVGIEDFMRKLISIVTGVSTLQDEEFTADKMDSLFKRMGRPFLTDQSVFTSYDSRVPHKQLLCDLLYAHKNFGTRVALIDNLNFLMDVTKSQDQIVSMDRAVHDFVVFCKKVPMHVIMIMHPRKTENGRIESEFDIKGSSTAVQEASNVLLFNRLADSTCAPIGMIPELCREIKFAKLRLNGKVAGSRLVLAQEKGSERYREGKLYG